jgi:hypothetical protein
MTVELVASWAPVPSINSRFEFQRSGIAPIFCLDWSFVTAALGKENYGKKYEF